MAFEHHLQEMFYGEAVSEVDDLADVDYAAVARAFGADGARGEAVEVFREAFLRGNRAEGSVVIDALTSIRRQLHRDPIRYDPSAGSLKDGEGHRRVGK